MTQRASEQSGLESPPQRFQPIALPNRLTIPFASRPPFDPLEPLPAGTRVLAGAPVVARAQSSAHVPLAPADGYVRGATRATLTDGRTVPAVVFEPDPAGKEPRVNLETDVPGMKAAPQTRELGTGGPADLGAWTDRFRLAGIAADRWTSPDLIGQLLQAHRRPVDTVICNALDLDPILPLQRRILEQWSREVAAAVGLLAKATGAEHAWLVVDLHTPHATVNLLYRAVESTAVRLVPLRQDYPRADPSLLLHTLTRRALRPGSLPTQQGVLLFDAAAAAAVGRYLLAGEAMRDLPLGVFDTTSGRRHFVAAPVGMAAKDVCSAIGFDCGPLRLRGGPPIRDMRFPPSGVIGAAELTLYTTAAEQDVNPDPCIRCAWCVEGCPVRIHPAGLLEAAQRSDHAMAERYGLQSCIECGICSFVCPSHLPLLSAIRSMKGSRSDE